MWKHKMLPSMTSYEGLRMNARIEFHWNYLWHHTYSIFHDYWITIVSSDHLRVLDAQEDLAGLLEN